MAISQLSFVTIPISSPEIIGPGRGAENWNGTHLINIPDTNSPDLSVDYYYRFQWSDIQNLTTGAFNYSLLDARVKAAIDRGSRFNFGVMGFYPGTGLQVGGSSMSYPMFLHNQMQAEPVYKDWRDTNNDFPGYNSWTPNWNSQNYRNAYNTLMDNVIAHMKATTYKGWTLWQAVGYVDIRTYGNTGEWTGYNVTYPGNSPANSIATAATEIQFISDFVARVPDKQLVICTAAVTGHFNNNDGQPSEVGVKVFSTSNSVGRIGFRRDCIAEDAPYIHSWFENNPVVLGGFVFKNEIMNIYKVAPWLGEPCSCCTNTKGGLPYYDFQNQVTFYHMAGFGNGNARFSGTAANIATEQGYMRAASKYSGYRLQYAAGSMTTDLTANAAFNVTLNWQNVGVACVYEVWSTKFELRAANGTVVWTGTSAFNPRLFLPSTTATPISDNFTLGAVANGTYSLYLKIVDPTGYRKPLPLAVSNVGTDGAYLIRSGIRVLSGVPTPPIAVPAGPSDLTLTKQSATLTSAGSSDPDGTVVGWAWSKVSGPGGDTIVSPSAATTQVTGLVVGDYVYQLIVTDNNGLTSPPATISIHVHF